MDELNVALAALREMVLAASGQPWVYALVVITCIIDGFFPPIPSEAIVVGLASLLLTQGVPNPVLLILAAAMGAFIGDMVAFGVGGMARTRRTRWLRGPRLQRSMKKFGAELDRRGAPLILAARFIPVGRVGVNLAAGATGYPRRKFVGIAALSATLWACYTVGIGALAGRWFHENQLLGMGAAIVFAVVLGLGIDWLSRSVKERAAKSSWQVPDVEAAIPAGDSAIESAKFYETVGSLGSTSP